MDIRSVSLLWEFPGEFNDLDRKSAQILSRVLTHRGNRGLRDSLVRENLVESLSVSPSRVGHSHHQFQVSVSLTESGLVRVQEVVARVLQALEYCAVHQVNIFKKKEKKSTKNAKKKELTFCSTRFHDLLLTSTMPLRRRTGHGRSGALPFKAFCRMPIGCARKILRRFRSGRYS
jgi:secreted Zn-dependent insulinase-like peptidase